MVEKYKKGGNNAHKKEDAATCTWSMVFPNTDKKTTQDAHLSTTNRTKMPECIRQHILGPNPAAYLRDRKKQRPNPALYTTCGEVKIGSFTGGGGGGTAS